VLPCNDSQEAIQEEKSGYADVFEVDKDQSQSDQKGHSHDCPPFCTCACHGMALSLPPIMAFEGKTCAETIDHVAQLITLNSFAHLSTVWQPPASC